ncbi:MAG: TetR/AcrR family transcriptional regulator, partial [bacterium]|nr:TetR/AcrR family transcriptional regulator [bacterium]
MARYQAGIRTEARILDATRELLGEVGLDGATLKAITERAGVRVGSFYNLFDSKESVVLRVVGEAIAAVDPDPAHLGTETLDDLVEAYIAFVTKEATAARIYVQIAVSGAINNGELHHRILRHHEQRVERFGDAMRRAQSSLSTSDATEQAEVLLATMNGLAFRSALDSAFDFASHVRA